jgi:hypothetical protein
MRYLIGKFEADKGVQIRRIIARTKEIDARQDTIEDCLALQTDDMDELWDEQRNLFEERDELGAEALEILMEMEL